MNESEISKTEIDIISNDTEFETAVIEDFYHHEAHALSACMMSPYDECAVLTCDGRGDYVSLTFITSINIQYVAKIIFIKHGWLVGFLLWKNYGLA